MSAGTREAAAIAIATTTACAPPTRESTFELRELSRSYTVVTRKDHDAKRPAPVVIALHAYATEGAVLPAALNLRSVAVADRDFVLVVPRGTTDSRGAPFWNATRACCDAERRGPDDVAYLRAVLGDVRARYAVDSSRVVAIGVSNGAFMAHRWACAPGGDLSGIVGISGAGPDSTDAPCSPSRPVSVLQIHGEADDVIRFEGGVMNGAPYPSATASARAWAIRDNCKNGAQTSDASFGGIGLVVRPSAWACPSARVALWSVPGGGHRLGLGSGLFVGALDFLEGKSNAP